MARVTRLTKLQCSWSDNSLGAIWQIKKTPEAAAFHPQQQTEIERHKNQTILYFLNLHHGLSQEEGLSLCAEMTRGIAATSGVNLLVHWS